MATRKPEVEGLARLPHYGGMTDTWGIPSQTFLWLFIVAALVAVMGTVARRRALTRGPDPARDLGDLPPYHVAYLTGGAQRAALASLAFLRRSGVVAVGDSRHLTRTGGLPTGATPLDSAVLHAAGRGSQPTRLPDESSVARVLHDIESDLVRFGLLLSAETKRRLRWSLWPLAVLLVLGVARIVAGAANDRPVGFLVLTVAALAVMVLVMWLDKRRLTRAGRLAVLRLRQRHEHLQRRYKPAWNTYDPVTTAFAVGLFGPALLWDADPLLAGAARVRDTHSVGGLGGDGGSGDGGSGGGDGGGGGCGGGGGGCGG